MTAPPAPDPNGEPSLYLPAAFAEAAAYTVAVLTIIGAVARYGFGADAGWIGALVSVGAGAAITWAFRHDIRRA